MKKVIFNSLLLILLALTSAVAQVKLSDTIPVTKDVRLGKLSNGLTYYLRKNSRPEQKVELRLVVKAGSILEDDDQRGLAHFTEHMSFNGSQHYKKNDLVSVLQTLGIKFGADLNASTSFDETIYILPVPVDKKENLETGLLVLEDWASTVAFEESEINKERGVVLEESRLGKGAMDRINKKVFPKLFEGSKYANRLPIGLDSILKTFPPPAIRRFYKDWYRPDLMAVIAVGDVDLDATEKLIHAHFGKLKNPTPERTRSYAGIPPREKSEVVIVTDPEATNSILQIYYSFTPDKVEKIVNDYRESLVRSLFQTMLRQRLQELTQKPNPPFVYGASSVGGFIHGVEGYQSVALIGQAGVQMAVEALILEGERARKFGFTSAELDRSKKNLLKGIERAYNERDQTESEDLADELIRNFLEDEPIPGIATEYQYYVQYVPTISLEEVNAYTAKMIPTSTSKLVVLSAPNVVNFKMPTETELLSWVDDAAKKSMNPYEEKILPTVLLETSPASGTIVAEKENKLIGVTELTLGNGIKVILKPTDFKNDQVMMTAFRPGGQFLYGSSDRYNAEYASKVVSVMGIGKFSPSDLRKILAGKSVNVSPSIGSYSEGMTGNSSAQDLEAMFQLVYLYFTQPRVDNELFETFISNQKSLYENVLSNPEAVFRDSVFQIMYKGNPRAPEVPSVHTFEQISQERSVQIYKDRFGDASDFTFVLVGKFDPTAIRSLLTTYLASLPSTKTDHRFKDIGLRPVRGVVKKVVNRGTEDKSFIVMQFTGDAPYSSSEQLKLQAVIEVLNIKVIEKLREEMGDIYGGNFYGSLNKVPYGHYSVGVSLPCGPENVDKLIQAALGEIEKIKKDGPAEADLSKVKENWKKQYDENLMDNSYWLLQLQRSAEMGSDPTSVLTYVKRVDALTTKELKATAAKYFDAKNYIQVVLYPEKKKD